MNVVLIYAGPLLAPVLVSDNEKTALTAFHLSYPNSRSFILARGSKAKTWEWLFQNDDLSVHVTRNSRLCRLRKLERMAIPVPSFPRRIVI